MLCPSCGFFNLPGSVACGRCGTPALAEGAVVDIQPPRARRPRGGSTSRWEYGLRRRWHQFSARLRLDQRWWHTESRRPLPSLSVVSRSLVPGWGHLYVGQRWRALSIAAAYAVYLAFALVFWGTTFGNIALGLAFAVHGFSILHPILAAGLSRRDTVAVVVLAQVGLALFLYGPAGGLIASQAQTMTIEASALDLRPGDTVVLRPNVAPRPGDLVIYDSRRTIVLGEADNEYIWRRVVRVQPGLRVGRLLGGRGQTVRLEPDGTLSAGDQAVYWDGMESDLAAVAGSLPITAWPDEVLVLSPEIREIRYSNGSVPPRLARLSPAALVGPIVWRTGPLRRWGPVK